MVKIENRKMLVNYCLLVSISIVVGVMIGSLVRRADKASQSDRRSSSVYDAFLKHYQYNHEEFKEHRNTLMANINPENIAKHLK